MKKGLLITIGWLLILCVGILSAAAEDISKDVFYNEGIRQLDDMTVESVKSAVDSFAAAGKYGQARNYRQYAKSLLEILQMDDEDAEVDVETVTYRLEEISQAEGFSESLEENEFPSCEMLIAYIQARQYEKDGNYTAARNAYGEAPDVLDALDRRIDLTPKAYRQAEELYRQGSYDAVVEALKDMTYKDSETMYREALKHVDHIWVAADCEHPKTCSIHGETEGEPLGHQWKEAGCTTPRTCARCGLTEGKPAGHDWLNATCTEPRTGSRCGETTGAALGHVWVNATCTEPQRCSRCGETNGTALGHSWQEASCTEPRICTRCGVSDGVVLGHAWSEATCTEPQRCTRCGATNGSPLGHVWTEATYTEPQRCARCGIIGEPAKPTPTPEPTPVPQKIRSLSDYAGVSTKMNNRDDGGRWTSYAGPGKSYPDAGGFKTDSSHWNKVTAYFNENGWIFAYIQYSGGTSIYAYLSKNGVANAGSLPQVSQLDYVNAVITAYTTPSWGPGGDYHSTAIKNDNEFAANANTAAKVFFQQDGYVYAEYVCQSGKTVRMWLPAGNVSVK